MKDYKRILQGIVNIINITKKSDIGFANICAYIGENCPELKESEDERIRKVLLNDFKNNCLEYFSEGINRDMVIAWLEKQGEQKFAWSEEDEEILRTIISDGLRGAEFDMLQINWLKSLKQRIGWKPSEEQIECLYDAVKHYQTNGYPASKLNELYEQMSKIYKL